MPNRKSPKLNQILSNVRKGTASKGDLSKFVALVQQSAQGVESKLDLTAEERAIDEIQVVKESINEIKAELEIRPTDGNDGEDGEDGKDGKDGVDGKDGKDGRDGLDGKDGKDGLDGKDGKDGIDGKDANIEDFVLPEDVMMEFDGKLKKLKEGLGGSTARNLYQLFDVNVAGISDNDILQYNSSTGRWDNVTPQEFNSILPTTVNAATYDLLVTDSILHVTYTTTGAVTSLTLPTAQATAGRTITIKDAGGNAGTNNITIDTEGSETIDGDSTWVINGNYDWLILYSDGSNWFIIG